MNEVQVLSDDINVITAEINAYQRLAGEAIFEIGRRLMHVKKHDLVHGEWENWCKNELGMTPQHANRFIRVTKELGEGDNRMSTFDLGIDKLFHIATMPEEQREQPQKIPSTGEVKTVDEMTVKELIEIKKELKKIKEEKVSVERRLNQELNKPPRTETKVIEKEIDKTDYSQINKLKNELSDMQSKLEKIQQQKESYKEWAEMYKNDAEEYQRMRSEMDNLYTKKDDLSRQIESATSISGLVVEIEHMLQNKLAPIKYSRAISEQGNNQVVINNVEEILGRVESWCKEMRRVLPGSNIIDVI